MLLLIVELGGAVRNHELRLQGRLQLGHVAVLPHLNLVATKIRRAILIVLIVIVIDNERHSHILLLLLIGIFVSSGLLEVGGLDILRDPARSWNDVRCGSISRRTVQGEVLVSRARLFIDHHGVDDARVIAADDRNPPADLVTHDCHVHRLCVLVFLLAISVGAALSLRLLLLIIVEHHLGVLERVSLLFDDVAGAGRAYKCHGGFLLSLLQLVLTLLARLTVLQQPLRQRQIVKVGHVGILVFVLLYDVFGGRVVYAEQVS